MAVQLMLQLGIGGNKKKKKANPNIEFVSPYPLEDCVWHLQNFPGVGEKYPFKTTVEMVQVDDETWTFKIEKRYNNLGFLGETQRKGSRKQSSGGFGYPKILAEGELKAMPSATTLVIGNVSFKSSLSIGSLAFVSIFVIVVISLHFPLNTYTTYAPLATTFIVLFFIGSIFVNRFLGPPRNFERFANAMKGHIKGVLGN